MGRLLLAVVLVGCGGSGSTPDARPQTGDGGPRDASIDAAADGGVDGAVDADIDAAFECTESAECLGETEPICSPGHECVACELGATGDADCAAKDSSTPRCAASGACVACLGSGDCSSPSAPVCDVDTNSCRGCEVHGECSNTVCEIATGECVSGGDVVFVATSGTDSGSCGTSGSPCATIGGAQGGLAKVTASRKWVKVAPGSYSEAVLVAPKSFIMIAAGADLSRGTVGPVLDIRGTSVVTIEGLRIHDGPGGTGDGVRCTIDGSDVPTVTLMDVEIDGNGGQGIEASDCTLSVERSRITGNSGGGISITSSDFSLVNNFIAKNGGISSAAGGVGISGNPPSGAGGARLDFNSISGNLAQAGNPSGVICQSISTPLVFSNSIVYGNLGVDGQVGGDPDCTWTYSDIQGGQAGTGNINADPLFENVSIEDYHIDPGSPARNFADPAASETLDIDGQQRGESGRSDMGADEVH